MFPGFGTHTLILSFELLMIPTISYRGFSLYRDLLQMRRMPRPVVGDEFAVEGVGILMVWS